MARSPSTNMNFWARAPLNLVADRVKNSVPPLLRTLRCCVGGQKAESHVATAQTTPAGCAGHRGSDGEGWSSKAWRKGVLYVGTTGSQPRWSMKGHEARE